MNGVTFGFNYRLKQIDRKIAASPEWIFDLSLILISFISRDLFEMEDFVLPHPTETITFPMDYKFEWIALMRSLVSIVFDSKMNNNVKNYLKKPILIDFFLYLFLFRIQFLIDIAI